MDEPVEYIGFGQEDRNTLIKRELAEDYVYFSPEARAKYIGGEPDESSYSTEDDTDSSLEDELHDSDEDMDVKQEGRSTPVKDEVDDWFYFSPQARKRYLKTEPTEESYFHSETPSIRIKAEPIEDVFSIQMI
jgi:hypothetical protein